MSTTNLPRYSSKLRETFHQINPYHISCTYKALFDDHALDILRGLSDVEDANNVSLLDLPSSYISPQKSNDASISQHACNSIQYGDDELGPCTGRFSYKNARLTSPGMYYKPDCQLLLTMFLGKSAIKTSKDAHTLRDQVTGPWQTCSLVESEECDVIHDVASTPNLGRVLSNGNANPNSARSPAIQNPLPFSSPQSARDSPRTRRLQLIPHGKHSDSKIKQSSDESPPKITKARSAHDYPRKEDISYPFSHGELHLGHIKQYRENVTKANLQQALMRCTYLNPSRKERFRMAATSIMMDCDMYRLKSNDQGKVGTVKGNKCPLDNLKEKDPNPPINIDGPFEQIGDRSPRPECPSSLTYNSARRATSFPSHSMMPIRNQTKGYESDAEHSPRKSVAKKKLSKVYSSTT